VNVFDNNLTARPLFQILPHLEEVVVRSLVVPLLKMSNDSCSLLHVMAPNIFQSEAAELLLVLLPLKAFFDKN
jgi:hypothetical protein